MIRVAFSAEFKKALHRLSKKYPHIRSDLQPVINRLAAGQTPGDRVRGVAAAVYKVRAPNRDARAGKSSGYRVICYLHTEALRTLLLVYSKTEREDISADELKAILNRLTEEG